ncbi:hypothetical protein DH2020_041355 [Rehmannia glutinosa]|uniref:D-glycerate 3-kinase n=1 Tax=Rehmannia glutinosa TaxID=99300 RepID=A0ABR0UQE3_REHGL
MRSKMTPSSSNSSGSGCSWLKNNSSVDDTIIGHGRSEGPLHSVFPTRPAEVSSVKDLFEFICDGPLMDKIGLTPDKVAESIDKWVLCGSQLCRLFQLNELYLTEPQKVRLYHYYIPVFFWCEQEISHHNSKFKDEDDVPPLVIGFSAPQGCGKTTLVFALDFLFRITGRKTATISIDDFYLTAEDQAKLRESNPGNALLESAYNGRGDRADPSTWPEVEGPLTAVLFEGWMLGFKPVPVEVVKAVDPQAEIAMRADGKPGMSDEEVLDFVSRYLPAYKAYLPTLYAEGPNGSDSEHLLVVEIDEGRNPILGV